MLCILWHALQDFAIYGTVESRKRNLHMHMRLLITLTSLVTSRLSLWTVTEWFVPADYKRERDCIVSSTKRKLWLATRFDKLVSIKKVLNKLERFFSWVSKILFVFFSWSCTITTLSGLFQKKSRHFLKPKPIVTSSSIFFPAIFVSYVYNFTSSFDWLMDSLCPSWLVSEITLVLMLRQSTENCSIWTKLVPWSFVNPSFSYEMWKMKNFGLVAYHYV